MTKEETSSAYSADAGLPFRLLIYSSFWNMLLGGEGVARSSKLNGEEEKWTRAVVG